MIRLFRKTVDIFAGDIQYNYFLLRAARYLQLTDLYLDA